MKKLVVILTVGFLLTLSARADARGHYCGWHRGWAPRPVVVVHPPCFRPAPALVWIAPHWGWYLGRRVWIRGFWR